MVERGRGYISPHTKDERPEPRQEVECAVSLLELRPFWHAIYADAYGLVGFFSGRREGPRLAAPREIYFLWPGGAHHAAAWLADEVAAARDVYQCAHLLTRPRRLKRYAAPLAALYVDLDRATLEHPAVPEPSLVVQSSPGRLQCYWQLSQPVDPAAGETLNRRLAYALGADRSGWDLTQLLRVPGTPNRKYADAPAVSVLSHTERRHDADALAASLPDIGPPPPGADDGAPPTKLTGSTLDREELARLPLSREARRILDGDAVALAPDGRVDRSASLVRIARVLHGAGVPPERIAATLAERDVSLGWRKYTDREDAARQYAKIAALVSR